MSLWGTGGGSKALQDPAEGQGQPSVGQGDPSEGPGGRGISGGGGRDAS